MITKLYDLVTKQPLIIKLQTINRCNARCIICPYKDTHANEITKVMNMTTWNKILDELEEARFNGWVLFCVQMEPFADPALLQRIRSLKTRTKARVMVITNGSFLNKANYHAVMGVGIDILYISLMSPDKDTYEYLTGLSFDYTVKVIDDLMPMMETYRTIVKIMVAGPDFRRNYFLMRDLYPELEEGKDYTIISPDSRAGAVSLLSTRGHGCLCEFNKGYDFCMQPFKSVTILADGSFILCDLDWKKETVSGNVNDMSIHEYYLGLAKTREQFASHVYIPKPCRRCSIEYDFAGTKETEASDFTNYNQV